MLQSRFPVLFSALLAAATLGVAWLAGPSGRELAPLGPLEPADALGDEAGPATTIYGLFPQREVRAHERALVPGESPSGSQAPRATAEEPGLAPPAVVTNDEAVELLRKDGVRVLDAETSRRLLHSLLQPDPCESQGGRSAPELLDDLLEVEGKVDLWRIRQESEARTIS